MPVCRLLVSLTLYHATDSHRQILVVAVSCNFVAHGRCR
jgi:hypothetical protein